MKRKFSKCVSAVLAASMVFTLTQSVTLNTVSAAEENAAEMAAETAETAPEDSSIDSSYEAVTEADAEVTEETETEAVAETNEETIAETEDTSSDESGAMDEDETAAEEAEETDTDAAAETEDIVEETGADYSGHVDTVTVNETDCYYFVPDSDLVGTRTCSSPIFIVFGDEDYTAETALAEAHTSGLAQLAEKEGSIVVFVSSSGDTWSDADDSLYSAILDTFSDSSTNTYVDGKTSDGVYAGTSERIYIYAEGSGADFVAERYLQEVISSITYSDGYTRTVNITPTCVNLFNVSVLADSVYDGSEVPAVVVNGPDGYEDLLANMNPDNGKYDVTTSSVTDGFDKDTLLAEYEKVTGTVRRQSGIIAPVTDYESYGITESINYYEIDAGTVKVYEYFTDATANAEDGTIPVVMLYHGGGSTAEYVAMASDWPVLGSQENFIVFAVQDHTSYTSDDMTELLYLLEEKYPQIDTSRIYASGFSMGAVKSWNTGMKYASVYAGIIPMDAGYMSEEDGSYSLDGVEISDLIMPVFYVGGTSSPLSELPHQSGESNNVDQMLEVYFDMNNIEGGYSYDETVDNVWGIESDSTETVTAIRFGTDLTIDYYNSEDGNCYTALCAVNGKEHEVYPTETYAAWNFISQFSRNEDGTVSINGETPADYSGHVDTVTVNETDCYYFVPDSDLVGTRTCSSPIFIVFGDEDYTAETALAEAHTSGLAQLAEKEGSIVVFVSSSGDTWSDADNDLYGAILDTFSDSSTNTYVDGKTSDGVYAGTAERIYIYAEGSGADFVAERYLQPVISSITYSDGYTRTVNITPTCVNLFNVSVLADSVYDDTEIPAVVVNGPDGYEDLLASLNPDNGKYDVTTSSVTDGFDKDTLLAEYEAVTGTVRRQSGIIAPVTDYESYGITESINYYEIEAGTLKVYEYFTDATANAEDGTIPVVMLYHGGGSTAEYVAMASDWPVLGSQENFIVFAVQDHTSYTSDDMTELLYLLEEKYPQIDTSRIYASGFSMGAVKSWNTGMKYADVYAGIIPMDAGYMSEEDGSYSLDGVDISDLIMPVFYVAGTASIPGELPHDAGESNNVDQMLEVYFDMNNIEGGYTYDETVDNVWGIESDATETVTAIRFGTDLTIDYYNSEDGNCYTALCAVNGKSHEVYPTETYAAWNFISQFSRNEDGTVSLVSEETATYDTSELEAAIAEAEALEESDYTAESWSTLQSALESAKAILASPESQEAIDNATANLHAAINALVLTSETGKSNATDTSNTGSTSKTDSTSSDSTSTATAKTGDYSTVYIWLVLLAAGGFLTVIATRKRFIK